MANKMHILGMAKSHLDLKGAKGPKLELDFLRLVYVIHRLDFIGETGKGFLLVFTQAIKKSAESWIQKYETDYDIEILLAELTEEEKHQLNEEKKRNREGMITGSQGEAVDCESNADFGKALGENKLCEAIKERYPDVTEITDVSKFPLGVSWDFYGRLN